VEGVSTDRQGLLSPVKLEMLRIWLRVQGTDFEPKVAGPGASGPALSDPLYALQAVINALVMGCVYALVAIGFSLVYGVIGRINLALGDMSSIAAYAAFTGVTLMGAAGTGWWFAGLMAVLLVAIGVAVLANLATERLIFRPLRGSSTQAPLIATIGLAIFLREFMRLAQGSRDRWLQPLVSEPYLLAAGEGHDVSVSAAQLLIVGLTVALCAILGALMTRSAFGRRYRACCDDFRTASLLGVNAGRTVALTFALSAVFAGAAGAVVAVYYGTVSAYMGVMIGFKALVAAVVGGMGSIAGAMLGGVLIALLESLWSSYLTMAYRDVVIFGLLAFVLVFRPNGLLGRPES
jgi:branched-chain amino acid transport system permease protein